MTRIWTALRAAWSGLRFGWREPITARAIVYSKDGRHDILWCEVRLSHGLRNTAIAEEGVRDLILEDAAIAIKDALEADENAYLTTGKVGMGHYPPNLPEILQ